MPIAGMKRWLAGIGIGIACLLGVLVIAVGVLALLPPRTRAIRGEESIAEIRSVELGGFQQAVLLRGNDRRNPILLYVHGGPGGGQLPLARHYSQKLEKYFLVVHWDQRGAGASGRASTGAPCRWSGSSMTPSSWPKNSGRGRRSSSSATPGAAWSG